MSTDTVSPLRQRMIEDMNARKLCAGTQRGHIHSGKRFAAFLKRSPETPKAYGLPEGDGSWSGASPRDPSRVFARGPSAPGYFRWRRRSIF